ncbi:ATP-grasp domain-containing protein [Planococcus sp. N064]|uniref:ATP-grasp domain-containing protein n=1 Tax=Planococcus liqunii TaxID=3058394 RepID=A0ABT8MNS0_9BACL|nr:ATP-grasp domain-containing protein [Planococcus sp. N064]MDN7226436.1 ATP-grasp domain-containing protein [Planococcus sp. N064]
MKRLLILGGSVLQIPGIQKAIEMGIYTIVLDNDSEAPGAKLAHEFFQISTMDFKKVLEIAKKKEIDGIITLASDQPMKIVSKVGEELKLKTITYDAALKCTDKGLMRKALKEKMVSIPKFLVAKNFQEFREYHLQFQQPFIVKPVNSSGSRGVQLVKEITQLERIYDYSAQYSSSREVIIEEYIEGEEFSVETMTYNGETKIVAITQKKTSETPFFVEIQHMVPAIINREQQEVIEEIVIKTVNAVGIEYGPSHCEVKLNSRGVFIIEIGARLGGDFISTKLVPLATGYDLVANTINISLGLKPNVYEHRESAALIKYFYSPIDGIYKDMLSIDVIKKSEYFYETNIYIEKNKKVNRLKSSNDRIGHYILKGENSIELLNEVEEIDSNVKVEIEGEIK